ncbi:50S ribosomal protein L25/general stress protein Ctc [Oricola cellulosilytica]|uniref:Large ribosomal subunit protein bL25 n=1 Tax=Oricola cellulosilytica TaxID=1429082 RepID=A0A4R0PCY0_9HYPH|nr:50S ribosomal protein L25/general stress protein Ctc [Oricola cellulosilytica]TCD15332.1 50S ribosomal protein L25/general stress protein Ctc [Oricola cellulosilytica]
MSESYVLKAEARERVGKGSARAIRRNGNIPAVIYGDNKPPLSITLPSKEVTLKIHGGGFLTTVGEIELDGKKHRVLPKSYDLDPVKDFVIHVDFLRISAKTSVTVNIPVHFINEEQSPGIRKGGVLNVVRHEVEVHCPADAIPEYFTVDLDGSELGDALKISSVELPEKVVPTITDRDFTIATIASPAGLKSEDEEEEAAAADEVEVIGEAGDEGEAEGGDTEEKSGE